MDYTNSAKEQNGPLLCHSQNQHDPLKLAGGLFFLLFVIIYATSTQTPQQSGSLLCHTMIGGAKRTRNDIRKKKNRRKEKKICIHGKKRRTAKHKTMPHGTSHADPIMDPLHKIKTGCLHSRL